MLLRPYIAAVPPPNGGCPCAVRYTMRRLEPTTAWPSPQLMPPGLRFFHAVSTAVAIFLSMKSTYASGFITPGSVTSYQAMARVTGAECV